MAQKVQVLYTDDIDGSEAEGTVTFAFEGVQYEIDLSEKNRAKLEKALGPYVSAARRVSGRARRKRGAGPAANGSSDSALVRAWAIENGYSVTGRGRIASDVREAYDAANA